MFLSNISSVCLIYPSLFYHCLSFLIFLRLKSLISTYILSIYLILTHLLSIYLSYIYPSIIYLSYLSIYISIYLSIYLSICLSLSTHKHAHTWHTPSLSFVYIMNYVKYIHTICKIVMLTIEKSVHSSHAPLSVFLL